MVNFLAYSLDNYRHISLELNELTIHQNTRVQYVHFVSPTPYCHPYNAMWGMMFNSQLRKSKLEAKRFSNILIHNKHFGCGRRVVEEEGS